MNKRQLKKKNKRMQNAENAQVKVSIPIIKNVSASVNNDDSMPIVMITVKDAFWKKIVAGEKTIDIRKAMPKGASFPLKAMVYVSRKGVAGSIIIDSITPFMTTDASTFAAAAVMTIEEIVEYSKDKELFAWNIVKGSVLEFANLKPLTEYGMDKAPTTWKYVK